ncbi:MAG TPA: META domain-containing protein [Pseudomonas xinjiangensis]|uniref:META domain-containing protein n=2 Tax=root TaxID=1 RepID=A0A7V1BPJ0_9GAMM|nr:META domain-containing protein [Halopseudomonas xinjiangensis]HEC48362.1 META domain-containing protein [Halopseudomonas xinjiangensis]
MQRPFLAVLLCLLSAGYLAGCSEEEIPRPTQASPETNSVSSGDEQDQIRISGSLTYQARIALQPDSHVIVELRYPKAGEREAEEVLASRRIDLLGREVPVEFVLEVDANALKQAEAYEFRARIVESDRPSWVADPVAIESLESDLELGELVLLPHRAAAFASILHCGRLQVSAGYEEDDMILDAAGDKYVLLPAESASGALFEAQGDPSTRFWSKGDNALLTLKGKAYPECIPPGALLEPFRAAGSEPSWEIMINQGELSVMIADEMVVLEEPYAISEDNSDGPTLQASGATVQVTREVCYETASRMPHPHTVTLTFQGETRQGCGGDPARLLRGAQWIVEDINGGGIIDNSRVVLAFLQNDRIAGQASCNNLSGEYLFEGQAFSIPETEVTLKACAPALMEQEQRFLEILRRVDSFRFDAEGALILMTGDNEILTARMQ